MNTLDSLKFKTELLAIKARLKSKEFFERGSQELDELKQRVSSDDNTDASEEEKKDWSNKMKDISEKLKNKSADALEEIDELIQKVDQKIRTKK
jgi:hypothetical protein